MGGSFRRPRVLVAAGLFALTAVGITASPADAAPIVTTCDTFQLDAAGVQAATPLSSGATQTVDLPDFSGGVTEVFPGVTYNLGGTPDPFDLPPTVDVVINGSPLTVTLSEIKNIVIEITVTGAGSLGTPTVTGGSVIGATATVVGGNILRLVFPGSTNGSLFAVTGDTYFPGGSTFQPPAIVLPITSGAAGTTISGTLTAFRVEARTVYAGVIVTNVRQICTPQPNSLGSVNVVAPPLPGAPNAVSDVATTNAVTPVVIDVLANDTPNADIGIDPASLKLTSTPANGGAVLTAGKVTYTPNPGFSGSDTFTYELCSLPDPDTAAAGTCDTATVTVTVAAAPSTAAVATTTTTTTAPAAPATPAAPAALPVTGRSSAPLTAVGLTTVSVGLVLLFGLRLRRNDSGA